MFLDKRDIFFLHVTANYFCHLLNKLKYNLSFENAADEKRPVWGIIHPTFFPLSSEWKRTGCLKILHIMRTTNLMIVLLQARTLARNRIQRKTNNKKTSNSFFFFFPVFQNSPSSFCNSKADNAKISILLIDKNGYKESFGFWRAF